MDCVRDRDKRKEQEYSRMNSVSRCRMYIYFLTCYGRQLSHRNHKLHKTPSLQDAFINVFISSKLSILHHKRFTNRIIESIYKKCKFQYPQEWQNIFDARCKHVPRFNHSSPIFRVSIYGESDRSLSLLAVRVTVVVVTLVLVTLLVTVWVAVVPAGPLPMKHEQAEEM